MLLCFMFMVPMALLDPAAAATGGPDAGGYRFIDSLESAGPTYNFYDISTTGTSAGVACDDCMSGAINIGFTFRFYEVDYTSVFVSSNGFVTFDSTAGNGCCSGQTMPDNGQPNNLIAGYWTDLHPGNGGSVLYELVGNAFIIQWKDVPRYGGGSTPVVTMQIKLFDDNSIEVHYLSAAADSWATAGIESIAGGTGLTYIDGFSAQSGLAVKYHCGPCHVVPVPPTPVAAYGHIWLTDTGTGVVATTSYDSNYFNCGFQINSLPPTVRCSILNPPPGQNTYWECAAMILRADTMGPSGSVRGEVDCDVNNPPNRLITADVTGAGGQDSVSGYLGAVDVIVCQAWGIGTANPVPTPPYQVECYEPGIGLPELHGTDVVRTLEPVEKAL